MRTNSSQNYFRKFISFIFCVAVSCGGLTIAHAQQNRILAGGDEPLTESMISRLVKLLE